MKCCHTVYGILTLSTGELSCANAGHEYPALCSGEGETSGGFRLHKVQHSPPLAAFPGVPFNAEDLSLKKGDILFVYTDGVTEATSSAGELFGEERMLSVLNQNTEKTPYEIIENMYGSLQSFIGDNEQFDDITMLALKFRG